MKSITNGRLSIKRKDAIMVDKTKFEGVPVATDDFMFYEEREYKVYIILRADKCNITEIKSVANGCNCNFIEAKKRLIMKKNVIAQGDAYEIKNFIQKISKYDIKYEIEPPYPY